MAIAQATRRKATVLGGRSPLAYVGYAALAAIVAAWTFRALHDPVPYDTGSAYAAGLAAWKWGRPELVGTWTGMPFLAAGMALVSRVISAQTAGYVVTALNVLLTVGAIAFLLGAVRKLISPIWWWVAAFALVTFGPLLSSVWFKQFNVIALVLAAAGFELVRRRKTQAGAAAIGFSVALKPMVILLPFVLLLRPRTRRAGAIAIAWIAGLNIAAQGLIALWAHRLATLNPLSGLNNYVHKTKPNLLLCLPVDFSPGSLLCRAVGGAQYWTLQRIVALCFVLLLGAWVICALRGCSVLSWEVFAFTCALSAMVSSFEWTHYQVMLAPLFVLLLFRFAQEGAGIGAWLGLAAAFVLASLIWEPYGTLFGTVRRVLTGRTEPYNTLFGGPERTFQEGIAQFAQYIAVATGILWYAGRRRVQG